MYEFRQIFHSDGDWQYAVGSGGITSQTSATIVSASAGKRNYLTALQIMSNALGANTEVVIRDGAGGTVLWRTRISTSGFVNGLSCTFPIPLESSVNTLLEVATLQNPTSGAIHFSAQGYTV